MVKVTHPTPLLTLDDLLRSDDEEVECCSPISKISIPATTTSVASNTPSFSRIHKQHQHRQPQGQGHNHKNEFSLLDEEFEIFGSTLQRMHDLISNFCILFLRHLYENMLRPILNGIKIIEFVSII